MSSPAVSSFDQLGLSEAVVRAVREIGYETPSPIQAAAIGPLLAGRDILGQAQTGTGKTAAFALPLLSRLDVELARPQILVLTPTRELAIQVAEALQTYARHMKGFHVLPVYGGQNLATQLRPLRRGVHAVVGTPGRILDHLRRATLPLDRLASVVLDEADEMLRMGFIDDVEHILEQAPADKQLALFSATLPEAIRAIARRHTRDPVEIRIETRTATVSTVSQRYWQVSGVHKLDALTRILEIEDFDAMVIFVRTKTATASLAERLEARGFSSAPLNGDMNQAAREQTVERLKSGRLDILIATDVAARGLDVDRISHVVNYDIPYDTEAYVHRIGRTARAGRKGEAILFVAPRERRMLRAIENATGQAITPMLIPSQEDIVDKRAARFKVALSDVIDSQDLSLFESIIASYQAEHNVGLGEIAAALAFMAQGDRPLLPHGNREQRADVSSAPEPPPASGPPVNRPSVDRPPGQRPSVERPSVERPRGHKPSLDRPRVERPPGQRPPMETPGPRPSMDRPAAQSVAGDKEPDAGPDVRTPRADAQPPPRENTERYRIDVGAAHGVQPKNIVGAIANEAGLESRHIGPIAIHDDHSLVDLPSGMPKEILKHLRKVWVCGRRLKITMASKARAPGRSTRPVAAAGAQPRPAASKGGPPGDKGAKKGKRKSKPDKSPRKHGRASRPA